MNIRVIHQQRFKLLMVFSCLLVIYMVGNYSGLLEGKAHNWWTDFFWTMASMLTALRSFKTAKKRPVQHERQAWNFFGLASLSWFVGMLIWNYYEIFGGELIPFPSVADWFFMGYALFFILGLFYYRTQKLSRQNNLIQIANLGLIVSTIFTLCLLLFSSALYQSLNPLTYEIYALLHPVVFIICFVFGIYCYRSYVWSENHSSFQLMIISLFVFSVTETLYSFQLLGHDFTATSYLNIYWLVAFALHYWAAFEQDLVVHSDTAKQNLELDLSEIEKYEAILPALTLFTVLFFLLIFNDQVKIIGIILIGPGLSFGIFLALREWSTHSLEFSLFNKLKKSNTQLQDIQKMAEIGHWERDLNTGQAIFSDEIFRIFGFDDPGNINFEQRYLDTIHPEDRDRVNRVIKADLENNLPYEKLEYRIIKPDGSLRTMFSQSELVYGKNGQAIRMEGFVQDITDRKQKEIEYKELLYDSDERVKELKCIYGVSEIIKSSTNQQEIYQSIVKYIPSGWQYSDITRARIVIEDREYVSQPFNKTKWFQESDIDVQGKVIGSIQIYYLEKRPQKDEGPFLKEERNLLNSISKNISEAIELNFAENELRKLSRAVEFSSSAVIITDLDGLIEYTNPKFSEITGYSKQESHAKNTRFLKSGKTPQKLYSKLWKTILSGKEWKGEIHNRKKDGSLFWAHNSISGVKNLAGELTHFICMLDDVTHEFEMSEKLSYQASHDILTGLINRYEFERRLERLESTLSSAKAEHALCFMDLDQFKVINDTCGHTAGDELLRQLSWEMQTVVRKRDTLARLGGDEFGVLMEHCSLEQAQRVAESLLDCIQKYQFSWEGQNFHVGISIGLVAINQLSPNHTELLKQADIACYMAKDFGRNRIHVHRPDDNEMTVRQGQMQWVYRINEALENDDFILYAQPIVPLNGNSEEHYEILLRMQDEDGKVNPPGAFLLAAERFDLIEKIDDWVVRNTFSLLANNPQFVDRIHFMSINLSGPSLTNSDMMETIMSLLRKNAIDPAKICFEVTETVAISNLNAAISFMTILKEIGCRFALDDFGSGLSSFAYLKNLPVDFVKIDGVFVKDLIRDPVDYVMVKSINNIGQVMGMETIAEFVENDEIKDLLKIIGVNYAQGYGVGKPQPITDFLIREK